MPNIPAPHRTASPVTEAAPAGRPEFYRMPKTGGDPFFGLPRAAYYELERAGKLRFVRLRRPGATRGIVLIPYAAVRALVEAAAAEN